MLFHFNLFSWPSIANFLMYWVFLCIDLILSYCMYVYVNLTFKCDLDIWARWPFSDLHCNWWLLFCHIVSFALLWWNKRKYSQVELCFTFLLLFAAFMCNMYLWVTMWPSTWRHLGTVNTSDCKFNISYFSPWSSTDCDFKPLVKFRLFQRWLGDENQIQPLAPMLKMPLIKIKFSTSCMA